MLYKSYLIEQNFSTLKNNITLFYGENIGLKKELKDLIKFNNKNKEIIKFLQDQILKNENILFNEINNISLFEKEKIIIIDNADDKILETLKQIEDKTYEIKIYIFSEILEKKSKIRNYFEKSKKYGIVPCYQDNEIGLKKIINNKLKGYEGLTPYNVNLIFENCDFDRSKLLNEIEKIKIFFDKKKIESINLQMLLNFKSSDNFDYLKDEALAGNIKKTNKLLSQTIIEAEKVMYYLNSINQRLDKLMEINQSGEKNLVGIIDNLKPPIFWKDKPKVIEQAKKWSLEKTKKMKEKTYNFEVYIKSNSIINKDLLVRKLIIDMCLLANA
mgnify:FL=1